MLFEVQTSSSKGVCNGGTITLNKWQHVAATYDGQTIKIYINGILEKSVTHSGIISTNSSDLEIGSRSGGSAYFDGKIDEFRIWNDARSANEIQDYLHKSLLGNEPGLVAYYPFDQTSGTSSEDYSQNGLSSTLNSFSGTYWVNASDREPYKTVKAGSLNSSETWKSGSAPSSSSDKLAVFHDLTLSSGNLEIEELNVTSGTSLTHNGRIDVDGNVIINGTCSGSNTIRLNGNSKQVLTGNGTLGGLTLNNSSGRRTEGEYDRRRQLNPDFW